MNLRRSASRSAALILLCFGLSRPAYRPAVAAASETVVPAPSQAFTPRTAIAFYANLQSASKSASWNAITNKAAPLMEQLQSLHQAQMASLPKAQALAGLQGADIAEIAMVIEGEKFLSGLQSEQLDPATGFAVVVRLARTLDLEKLIQQGLEVIEKEKHGLRGPIEKSRRRVGAAEVFDVPAEALVEHKLPFAVSVALGAGKESTIIALGRSESLQAFLTGKTEGKLRGQVNDSLSRRGQIWLYLPVPQDAAKGFGGSSANANPMLAGLAQSMDKVREVSLILNFGASQVDFVLEFGCADGAAATQLSQGVAGLLGMIQMSAQQNPASTPPFIGKIKAAADGAAFRLTTAFTMRDFDLAFQNANRGVAGAPPRALPPPAKVEATPAPAPSLPPVDVEFVQFTSEEQESLRPAKLKIQNRSSRPVKELKLTFTYLDQSGRKLGQWTRNHASLTAENLIGGDTTGMVDCLAFNVPAAAKKVSVTLHEVIFSDGEKWSGK
jgi:hypothetical protein